MITIYIHTYIYIHIYLYIYIYYIYILYIYFFIDNQYIFYYSEWKPDTKWFPLSVQTESKSHNQPEKLLLYLIENMYNAIRRICTIEILIGAVNQIRSLWFLLCFKLPWWYHHVKIICLLKNVIIPSQQGLCPVIWDNIITNRQKLTSD